MSLEAAAAAAAATATSPFLYPCCARERESEATLVTSEGKNTYVRRVRFRGSPVPNEGRQKLPRDTIGARQLGGGRGGGGGGGGGGVGERGGAGPKAW